MKSIEPIKIGDYFVTFQIKRVPLEPTKPYAVDVVATCETEVRESRASFHPMSDKNPEDFWKDIQVLAQKLAGETVGHLKAKKALDSIFDG